MSRPLFILCSSLPRPASGCRKCGKTGGYLARYIYQDGRTGIRWQCGACKDYATRMDLPAAFLGDWSADELPVCCDNRAERNQAMRALNQRRCLICREPFSDLHHWAPRAIFPEDEWDLVVPLCRDHHNLWHDRMRINGLRWPHELETAA